MSDEPREPMPEEPRQQRIFPYHKEPVEAVLKRLSDEDRWLVEDQIAAGWVAHRKSREQLPSYAYRTEPVCRNCIYAGPFSGEGNHPYANDIGSCQRHAPGLGASGRVGDWSSGSVGTPSRFPSIHHTDTCGDFKLKPVPAHMRVENLRDDYHQRWAWADPAPPSAKGDEP